MAASWAPSVQDVANQLRARTKGGESEMEERGTFDSTTRPTGTEVQTLIDGTVEDIRGLFTAADVPERCQALAKRTVALRTALQIELSYFPEQAQDNSPYLQLRALADGSMQTLIAKAVALDAFGEDPIPSEAA